MGFCEFSERLRCLTATAAEPIRRMMMAGRIWQFLEQLKDVLVPRLSHLLSRHRASDEPTLNPRDARLVMVRKGRDLLRETSPCFRGQQVARNGLQQSQPVFP